MIKVLDTQNNKSDKLNIYLQSCINKLLATFTPWKQTDPIPHIHVHNIYLANLLWFSIEQYYTEIQNDPNIYQKVILWKYVYTSLYSAW